MKSRPAVRNLVIAVFAVMAFVTPSNAQTEIENPGDPYVHELTGMRFPANVGPFQRHQVTQYLPDGSDMGFGYQLIRDGRKVGYVSIFIYPAPKLKAPDNLAAARNAACKAEFDGISQSILSRYPETRLVEEQTVSAPSKRSKQEGYYAAFEGGKTTFDAQPDTAVSDKSYLYCYAGGRWLVAYRMTWPKQFDVSSDFVNLMNAIEWSDALRGS